MWFIASYDWEDIAEEIWSGKIDRKEVYFVYTISRPVLSDLLPHVNSSSLRSYNLTIKSRAVSQMYKNINLMGVLYIQTTT